MPDTLELGFFIQPVHPPSRPYADVLREDREAVVLADRLGYREAFIGEHLVDSAVAGMAKQRVAAVIVDAALTPWRAAELVSPHRLPSVSNQRNFVDAGGLIFHGAQTADLHRRAAASVDQILKGTKPAQLPVERPTTFELVINLKAARTLGLAIPPSLLVRADQIIE